MTIKDIGFNKLLPAESFEELNIRYRRANSISKVIMKRALKKHGVTKETCHVYDSQNYKTTKCQV